MGRIATAGGNDTEDSRFRRVSYDAWAGHFTEHINFVCLGGSEVEVVVRFEGNILRKIAALEEAFEIERQALAVPDKKTVSQIGQFDTALIGESGFQTAGPRDGFNDG